MTLHSNPPEICRRARPLLGTIVEIGAAGPEAAAAIEGAFAMVAEVHRLMGFHDPDSDVSRINRARAGEEVFVHPHTHRVLRFSRRMSAASEGVFDVTIADVLVRHGFLPAFAQEPRRSGANWADLEILAGNRLCWRKPGCIDLGGIAKGYAVDLAIEVLRSHAVIGGQVSAGGDLRIFGEAQPVHVRLPDSPGFLAPLGSFTNCALATTASYFSTLKSGSGSIEPLVDRERRISPARQDSTTVVAPDCMTADALTKVVRLAPRLAPKVLDEFDARAILVQGTRRKDIGSFRYDGGQAA